MPVSVAARRAVYRLAYRLLAIVWRVLRVRPDGVKCLIVAGDRLLLVRHTYGPPGWDLPGGGSRRDETPTETAEREMDEELGLRIAAGDWRDLGTLSSVRGSHRVRILGVELSGAPALRLDPVELADATWFARDAIPAQTGPLLSPILAGAGSVAESPLPFTAPAPPGVATRP